MKDLNYYALKSINVKDEAETEECDLTLDVDGEEFHAYEVSIAERDLLFLCDKATLNYVVDSYGDRVTVELFNVDKE